MKLKVCGLRDLANVNDVLDEIAPDYVGLIFYKKSPRAVDENLLGSIVESIPSSVKKVGVFVDEKVETIESTAGRFNLDYLQLHGHESAGMCAELNAKGFKVIKAFGITQKFDFDMLEDYMPYVKFFLFDTKGEQQGGNGYAFDWKILEDYNQKKPFFLSGGISLENIAEIKEFPHLNIHAVDVNSRFELSPGIKNIAGLKGLRQKMDKIK